MQLYSYMCNTFTPQIKGSKTVVHAADVLHRELAVLTCIPPLWFTIISTPFQQEYSLCQQLWNVISCNCIVILDLQCIFGFEFVVSVIKLHFV